MVTHFSCSPTFGLALYPFKSKNHENLWINCWDQLQNDKRSLSNSVSHYGIGIKTVPWPLSGSQQSILDRPRQEHKPGSSKELKLVFLQSAVWSQDPKPLSHLRLKRLLLDAAVVRGLLLVVRGRRVGGGGGAVRRLRPLIGGLRGGVGRFRGRIGGGCRGGVWRSCWCFVGRGGGRVSKRGFRCGKEGGEARAAVEGMSFHLCR